MLIAVNPYRDLGLYGDHILHGYVDKNRIEVRFFDMDNFRGTPLILLSSFSDASSRVRHR